MYIHTRTVWTIYALLDPFTRRVRYVGQTARSAADRFREHWSPKSFRRDTDFAEWMRSLHRVDARPELIVLETVEASMKDDCDSDGRYTSLSRARDAERRWIEHYLSEGAHLLNRDNIHGNLFTRRTTAG